MDSYNDSRGCSLIQDPKAAIEELKKVVGHLVELPERFLENQSLTPAPGTKEHLLPVTLWT